MYRLVLRVDMVDGETENERKGKWLTVIKVFTWIKCV